MIYELHFFLKNKDFFFVLYITFILLENNTFM